MGGGRRAASGARRRGTLYRPLCFLLVIATVIFSVSVFFKTLHIEVVGAGYYSEEQIIEASGVETGTNLFLVNKGRAVSGIFAALPYVERAFVARRLPGTIVITVEESGAVAYIADGGSCWLLSGSGKVLAQAAQEDAAGLIRIIGITPAELAVGSKMAVSEDDAAREEFLTAVLSGLESKGMNASVTEMDVSNVSNLTFDYEGRFSVKLGQYEDLDNKLEMLRGVVEQLTDTDRGTIDLSMVKEAHFIPE